MERVGKAKVSITLKPNSVDPVDWARYNEPKKVPEHIVHGARSNARTIDTTIKVPSLQELAGTMKDRT